MANVVAMPRQGNTVESCVLVGWRVAEGTKVAASDIICEVETDKAVFEVPAGFDGLLLKRLAGEGDDVPVLAPIAVIGEKGEDWSTAVPGGKVSATAGAVPNSMGEAGQVGQVVEPSTVGPESRSAAVALTTTAAESVTAAKGAPGVSPRARALAASEAFEAATLAGSGPGGRVIERDVRAALEARAPLGAAARAAIASGEASAAALPLAGSGIGGRVRLADMGGVSALEVSSPAGVIVQAGTSAPSNPVFAPSSSDFPGPLQELPIKGIRKVIADRMHDSLATTAQYTLHATASALRLQALRARMKSSSEALGLSKVTVGDLVLFAVSRVLKDHPMCNAHKLGDTVRVFERVHLGLAVDTPRGLMVPVLRNADLLSLAEISREAKRLASACIEGRITPDELSGSTFTVSNLGGFGVDYFTPVINAPEVCVLGVGAILPRPTEGAEGVTFVPGIALSLTSDHQVVDGAPGARFLKDIGAAIADIDLTIAR